MNWRDRVETVADEKILFATDVPRAVYFDAALEAWIVSRYSDVAAALRDVRVALPGTAGRVSAPHAMVRDATAHAFAPERLEAWRDALRASAHRFATALPVGEPVDLVQAFARPWCLAFAVLVSGIAEDQGEQCASLARRVFMAAAMADSGVASSEAMAASSELSRILSSSQIAGHASADVQSFVALSQTLPGLLAGAWLELARHPLAAMQLRQHPELMPAALGELLRLASPSRAVFREALTDLAFDDAIVSAGDKLILLLSAANRDPDRFPNPQELDLGRAQPSHLGFGAGAHYCAGTMPVRMALEIATYALLSVTDDLHVTHDVAWIGGYAIRAPGSLSVILSRNPLPANDLTPM